MDSAEHLTEEQHQRIAALNTASACTSKRVNAFAQAAGMTGGIQVLPGDLVRIAHWIVTGESVIITDDETVVMRDDAGWTKISMEGPAKAPAGDGHLFWAPLGATHDPEGFERKGEEGDMFAGPAWTGKEESIDLSDDLDSNQGMPTPVGEVRPDGTTQAPDVDDHEDFD